MDITFKTNSSDPKFSAILKIKKNIFYTIRIKDICTIFCIAYLSEINAALQNITLIFRWQRWINANGV